jgi:hypothetical protein
MREGGDKQPGIGEAMPDPVGEGGDVAAGLHSTATKKRSARHVQK